MKKVLIDTHIYSMALKGDATVVSILRKVDLNGYKLFSRDKHFALIPGLVQFEG